MGSQLESASKLMYYPTDIHETYRILGVVGRLSLSPKQRDKIRETLGEEVFFKLLDRASTNLRGNFAIAVYHYLLEQKEYEKIKKYFEISMGYFSHQVVTVFDPFAGEAEWLETFKNGVTHDKISSPNIHLIANEVETNRYNSILNKEIVDEVYNQPFEGLNNIPKHSISLMLFNPPYGDTNGVRNTLHYLDMVIKEDLLYKSNSYNRNGRIVMVVRKDDLLLSLPLLTKYFVVHEELMYRANKEEYKRYKQFIVYASIRNKELDENNVNEAIKHQDEISRLTELINSKPEFKEEMYNTNIMSLSCVDYERLKKNHSYIQNNIFKTSDSDSDAWNWIKEMTEIKEIENEQIDKPTPMKTGEIANLIASGMINGEMSYDSKGNGYHIVAGGTKQQMKQEIVQEEGRDGKLKNKTKTLLYSQPYLNILVSNNGKLEIKELQGEEDLL